MAASQTLLYSTSSCGALPGNNIFVHGQTVGFSQLAGSSINSGNPVNCRDWTYENPTNGGSGNNSIGYWGNIFGSYSGCDLGITQTGYDVQTTEVLTSGGNDTSGPAGEQIIGHVFRRPQASVTSTGSGSLSAGTYYVKVTAVDAAGRESAPSPEISQTVGASSSINLSATTGIFFPASCNFYFGTSAGQRTELLQLHERDERDVHVAADDHLRRVVRRGKHAASRRQRDALLAHRGKQRQFMPVLRVQRRPGNRFPRVQSDRGAIRRASHGRAVSVQWRRAQLQILFGFGDHGSLGNCQCRRAVCRLDRAPLEENREQRRGADGGQRRQLRVRLSGSRFARSRERERRPLTIRVLFRRA